MEKLAEGVIGEGTHLQRKATVCERLCERGGVRMKAELAGEPRFSLERSRKSGKWFGLCPSGQFSPRGDFGSHPRKIIGKGRRHCERGGIPGM